jgi:hypothetical protein
MDFLAPVRRELKPRNPGLLFQPSGHVKVDSVGAEELHVSCMGEDSLMLIPQCGVRNK